MQGSNSLKSVQMALVTFITQTGVGILTLPSALVVETGHDGWVSIFITGIIITVLSVLFIIMLKRYSDKAIYDINQFIFGKIIGKSLNALIILYLLAASVAGAALFNYFIRMTILKQTPPWVLAPFITLPSFYLVWQGLKHVSRFLFCSVLSYLLVIVLVVLLYNQIRFSFLMPLGEAGIARVLQGTRTCFFAFIGFELIVFFYPYISDKGKMIKWQIGANLASTLFFMIVMAFTTAVFGENLLSIMTNPFFNISRIYNAPILERVDLYLIALWFIPTACSMRTYTFAAYDGLQKVFNLKKNKFTYMGFFVAILFLSSIPKDINQIFFLLDIINYVGLGFVGFLLICVLLSFIRKRGVIDQ